MTGYRLPTMNNNIRISTTPTPRISVSPALVSVTGTAGDPLKSMPFFSVESLQQRLQTLIEGAREAWTYAIFWQSSVVDFARPLELRWGNGYYIGEEDKNKCKTPSFSPYFIAEQEHRKKVLREVNSLIFGKQTSSENDVVHEVVTDTEWFFLISMSQSYVNGSGLPGQAMHTSSPIWVTGTERLTAFNCERARQAQGCGLQTMVCIPSTDGVVELGSTELISRSSDLMDKVKVLFNFNTDMGSPTGLESGSFVRSEPHLSALRLTDS